MPIEHAMQYMESNAVEGWLQETAAEALCMIASGADFADRPVCEIGVHHGKLAIFLALLTGGRLAAFDLFEHQDQNVDRSGRGNKRIFLQNCRKHGLAPEQVAAVSLNSLTLKPEDVVAQCGGERPAIFSVDGGHTAELTANDLKIAAAAVAPDGIVVLDDFFNQLFPEVCWGTMNLLRDQPDILFPVCIAGGKLIFARSAEHAAEYRSVLANRRAVSLTHISRFEEHRFFERPVVVMWPRRHPESARQWLAQTPLWQSVRDTRLGETMRRLTTL